MTLSTTIIGLLIGLVLGVIFVGFGALNAFFVGLTIFGGWVIAKIVTGEWDLFGFMESRSRRRNRG